MSDRIRIAQVHDVRRITPTMQRVTLRGPDLQHLSLPTFAIAPHIKLLIPPGDREPVWPELTSHGRLTPHNCTTRTYTVRNHRPEVGEIDVDFVLHGEDGIASRWATRACRGDRIGLWERSPTVLGQHSWFLFLGDQTALPGIGQALGILPASAQALAVIQLENMEDRQNLVSAAAVDVLWTPRAEKNALLEIVQKHPWPRHRRPFIWVGAEAGIARPIRNYLRQVSCLNRSDISVVNYWKDGVAETSIASVAS